MTRVVLGRADRAQGTAALLLRVEAEYREMPGPRLTVVQAARLFGISIPSAIVVMGELRDARVLKCNADATYSLVS